MPHIKRPSDFWSGALFLVLGASVLFIASGYEIGTLRRMGAGYFPLILGALLCLLALALLWRGLTGPAEGHAGPPVNLRILALVLGGVLAFALLVRSAGLVPAVLVMVLCGTLAWPGYGLRPAVMTALLLAGGAGLVFVHLLGQPIALFAPLF